MMNLENVLLGLGPSVGIQVMPIISALRRLRQEDLEFKAGLGCIVRSCVKKKKKGRCQWLISEILATQEAQIGSIMVQSQPRKIVHKFTGPYLENT
jgi:hypothetical protein